MPAATVTPPPTEETKFPLTVRLPAPDFVSSPESDDMLATARFWLPVSIVPPPLPMTTSLGSATAEPAVLWSVAPLESVIPPEPSRPAPSICTVPPETFVPPTKSLSLAIARIPAPVFASPVEPVILSPAVAPLKV